MRRLMLLRHAKTEHDAPSGRDQDRRLDKRGHHDAADIGGVMVATLVQPAVLIAARGRVVFGLGVTQQHQTAHGAISIRFKSAGLMFQAAPPDKVTSARSVRKKTI